MPDLELKIVAVEVPEESLQSYRVLKGGDRHRYSVSCGCLAIFAHEDAVNATVLCAACNMKAESAPAERRFCVRHRVDYRIPGSRLGDFIEKISGA